MIKKRRNADVVIIGGGINGCYLAYMLSKKDLDVILFERSYLASGATGRCGAGIRQQWSTVENAKLSKESVEMFEKLSFILGEDIEFTQGGYLIAIHNEKELNQSKKNVEMQRSLGIDVDIIGPEKIVDIAPVLDVEGMDAIAASFCPTDGHANPFKTTFALANQAEKNGAEIYTDTNVFDITVSNSKIKNVKTDIGIFDTNIVINAAGVWSKNVAEMINIDLPSIPLRKEIMVTERLKPLFECMVISFRDGIYFSQQPEGHIVGGIPIPDEKPGFRTLPTFNFLTHMADTLIRYAPGFKNLNILRHWTGFYDVTPDARPLLGEVEKVNGFIQCNGFSGHGFMLAPMVSKILTDYIVDGEKSDILDSLNISRFKDKNIRHERNVVG